MYVADTEEVPHVRATTTAIARMSYPTSVFERVVSRQLLAASALQ